jgi:hypothetical protein
VCQVCDDVHMETRIVNVKLDPSDPHVRLQDAKTAFEWALRHGNPSDVSRSRRFLREASAAAEGRS